MRSHWRYVCRPTALPESSTASGRFPPTARYFGTTPEFWINMQAEHDLSKARAEIGKHGWEHQ
jgi:hypothetical protein